MKTVSIPFRVLCLTSGAEAVDQGSRLIHEIPGVSQCGDAIDHSLDLSPARIVHIAPRAEQRSGSGYLETVAMLEQELARAASPKQIERPPENGNGPESVFRGKNGGKGYLSRKVTKVVFLKREKHIIEPKVFHFPEVAREKPDILLAHVTDACPQVRSKNPKTTH